MTTDLNTPRLRFAGFHEEWERRKFSDLYEVNKERNEELIGYDKTLSVASMTFRNEGNGAAESSLPTYKVLRLGDIAFEGNRSREFKYGRFVVNDVGDGIMSPRFRSMRPLQQMPVLFWKYYIHCERVMRSVLLNCTKAGTMMNELVEEDFLKQSILAPTLPEQQKIGAFFSSLDAEISREQERVEKLRQLKAACLQDMFPREGENAPRVRFDGCSGEWERRKLGDVAEKPFKYGLNAAAKDYDGHNKYLRITDIDDELRTFDYNNLSSPNAVELTNDYLLQECDIVFARTGASVGKTYLYDKKDGKVFYAGFLIRARIKSGYCPYFIFTSTLLHSYQQYIRITSQRSGQPGVNAKEYEQYSFLAPTLPEQQKIGAFFSSLDAEISREQERVEKLRQLKAACLGRMFVGG